MKKILLMSMMVLTLGACTSNQNTTTETDNTTRLSRDTGNWVDQAGNVDSENWWVEGYSEDSDD